MFLKRILPPRLKELLKNLYYVFYNSNFTYSYAQEGEDKILLRYFRSKPAGFFVDVGAHHPQRFSNTFLLYKLGWRGINIDAMPGSMSKFNDIRKYDINIEAAISDRNEIIPFYVFEEKAINTFSKELADKRIQLGWPLKEVKEIQTRTLTEILDSTVKDRKIDLLSIDVEGLDYKVLCSLDWTKYQPHIIITEELSGFDFKNLQNNLTYVLLSKYGYEVFAKTYNSVFFINRSKS
jgi:FkbM family methyltransferase